MLDPYRGTDVGGKHLYDLRRDERFDVYRDRLVIDWGPGTRSWAQWADKQDKPVPAIRDAVLPPFPGPGEFTADSFWGRWTSYAQNSHGGNAGMKARPNRHCQVSILQVVDVDQSDHAIEHLEARWKRRLLTREHGLNQN